MIHTPNPDRQPTQWKSSEKPSNSGQLCWTALILCSYVIPPLCNFVSAKSDRCKIPPFGWNGNLSPALHSALCYPKVLTQFPCSDPDIPWFPAPCCSGLEADPTLLLCQLSPAAVDFSGYSTCPHQYQCYFTLYSLQKPKTSIIRSRWSNLAFFCCFI